MGGRGKEGRKEGKRREKRQREGQVPAPPVKHFSGIWSSRLVGRCRGFFTPAGVMADEGSSRSHLEAVTTHPTLPQTPGQRWPACVSVNMRLRCCDAGKATAQSPLSTHHSLGFIFYAFFFLG